MRINVPLLIAWGLLAGCAERAPDRAALVEQVLETERAFARTMAERDHAAFTAFLAEEAIFYSGEMPLRGKDEVAAAWRPYFESAAAPFAWEPERVEVLDSGTLALSTGPVTDDAGNRIATFTSIWRREAQGRWHIVFDRGSPACASP